MKIFEIPCKIWVLSRIKGVLLSMKHEVGKKKNVLQSMLYVLDEFTALEESSGKSKRVLSLQDVFDMFSSTFEDDKRFNNKD